jgi:hypothetical protein
MSAKDKIARTARLSAASLLLAITFSRSLPSLREARRPAGVIPGQYIVVLKDGVDGKAVTSEQRC